MRKRIGETLQGLLRYRGIQILEGPATVDHISLSISVQTNYNIALVIGYLKGKSVIWIHKEILWVKKGFTNKNFWTRGYCVTTVVMNEQQIREHIRNQEKLEMGKQESLNIENEIVE